MSRYIINIVIDPISPKNYFTLANKCNVFAL